jgi:RNA polymerase sigma-54 factor
VDSLDDSGYFIGDIEVIADQLQCDVAEVSNVLAILQSLDPAGVFARNLQECLELQLKDRNRFDPVISKLLENLDILAKGDLRKLSKLCKVSEAEIKEMCQEIKQLNPKPGGLFVSEAVSIHQPDVFLKKGADQQWVVELNSQALPKVLVNKSYYATLSKGVGDNKEHRKYMVEQMNTASWLARSLNQRAQTILKVATEVVSQQSEFFEKGIRYI